MNNKLWNASLFLALVKPMPIMFFAAIFTIIGLFDLDVILLIGMILWVLYFSVSLFCFLRMQYWMNYRCDNEDFNNLMDELTGDPDNFLKKRIEEYDLILQRHGEALLDLSDSELLEAVRLQNFAIMSGEINNELEKLNEERRIVYVLSCFDNEIQNGGLHRFFANYSEEIIALVPQYLDLISACEHKALFDSFILNNSVDKFNAEYYKLPPLENKLVEYIRANVTVF